MPVIIVTAVPDVGTAVRCMKLGAIDYLIKPVEPEQLVTAVERTLEHSALLYESVRLREQFCADKLEKPESFAAIVGSESGHAGTTSRKAPPVSAAGSSSGKSSGNSSVKTSSRPYAGQTGR